MRFLRTQHKSYYFLCSGRMWKNMFGYWLPKIKIANSPSSISSWKHLIPLNQWTIEPKSLLANSHMKSLKLSFMISSWGNEIHSFSIYCVCTLSFTESSSTFGHFANKHWWILFRMLIPLYLIIFYVKLFIFRLSLSLSLSFFNLVSCGSVSTPYINPWAQSYLP